MNAFILSGGGTLGSIQVGMLRALFETDIRPDVLVGTSIGSVNAAFLAAGPSSERVEALRELWHGVRPAFLGPGSIGRADRSAGPEKIEFSREKRQNWLVIGHGQSFYASWHEHSEIRDDYGLGSQFFCGNQCCPHQSRAGVDVRQGVPRI